MKMFVTTLFQIGLLKFLFVAMGAPNFKEERVYFTKSGVKGLIPRYISRSEKRTEVEIGSAS